jgi:hypothetical protein
VLAQPRARPSKGGVRPSVAAVLPCCHLSLCSGIRAFCLSTWRTWCRRRYISHRTHSNGSRQKGGKALWPSSTHVPRISTGMSTTIPSLGCIGNAERGLSDPVLGVGQVTRSRLQRNNSL